ncbi:hypothetical protein BDW59DRAFT_110101 [Aspergillus cavernicola]|uniref:Fungal N-terminal domain-containing protein n=1 Tax=Aspergillus cavernicola TaxID=176166 RepID=A0ABR4I0X2_9EURO
MEPAGVILATIPLILVALDKYVETLETIRLFGTESYRRYLERYSNLLSAHRASLLNAIEIALGVTIGTEEATGLLSHLDGSKSVWRDPKLQAKLRNNLGRDYEAFSNVMGEANRVLQELNHKLEKEVSISSAKSHSSRTMREIRKVKSILSKRKYDHLFENLDASISLLNRLVDQSLHRQECSRNFQGSRCEIPTFTSCKHSQSSSPRRILALSMS